MYKMAVTVDGEYIYGKQYDILTQVYYPEDGCSYVSRKANKNVRPGTDPDTWQKVSSKGDIGATGLTPNIKMGTVVTGDAGTQADATITGTLEEPVINLTIPRGDPGEGGGSGSDPNAVKYTEQELTDAQKAQARENIGACSAIEAPGSAEPSGDSSVKYTIQDLTSAQKTQARQNIGAGTSSFSGSYNDLQDKPQQVTLSKNVVADKSATNKAYSCKATYDDVHPAMVYEQPSGGMLPNVFYDLGVLDGGSVTFSLAAPLDASVLNHYFFVFRTGETVPTVTWPSNIVGWINGGDPELVPMTHYEISIINGYAAFLYI